MRSVPREDFLPAEMREFAYEDTPLPIEADQTISQPYIVAFMVEALALEGGERVLEIGAGSGYAAAVLSRIAGEVYTVERIGQLAEKAAARLADLGYGNVHVLHGDGTKGWPEHMPYDAIVVAAGGPKVPDALKLQLKIGGRLVIPVGKDRTVQELVRITRVSEQDFKREDLADVRFVPLVGEEGWERAQPAKAAKPAQAKPAAARERTLPQLIADACEPFDDIETASLDGLMERIGDSRIVLLGEASHGTSEFYRMRERITRDSDREERFPLRRDRRRLAGCRARRSLRAPHGISAVGMDRLCAVSGLDVAQCRGARLRRLAAQLQCRQADGTARCVSRPRSLLAV